jgi:hypothetical protein
MHAKRVFALPIGLLNGCIIRATFCLSPGVTHMLIADHDIAILAIVTIVTSCTLLMQLAGIL